MEDSRALVRHIRTRLGVARDVWRASDARGGAARGHFFGARKHRFELSPPVSEEAVHQWEAAFQVELPGAYRTFLTQLGVQGAGPFYGLDSPWGLSRKSAEARADYGRWMRAPCPVLEQLPPGDAEDTRWLELMGGPDWEARFDQDVWSPSQGTLPLVQVGCGEEIVLILNGPLRGRLCQLCEVWQTPRVHAAPDFLTWYADWLEDVILGADLSVRA
ncbi:SMI1/KNR4 family protein [Archangium primigenium]|uniref:SMI1/KNR4 family protein n=1 Tax=[Archangium] primigenium TaxID=2792470 RepID=UPI00195C22DF|nr:SMI1/KNR4 family protein [Archangium primigenium]MBM7116446.1 SMI1/KNR4 family protein [Archangium primigenium]